jgi:hypothetical protein
MKRQVDLLCDDPQPLQEARVQDIHKAFEQFQERQRLDAQMHGDTLSVLASIFGAADESHALRGRTGSVRCGSGRGRHTRDCTSISGRVGECEPR